MPIVRDGCLNHVIALKERTPPKGREFAFFAVRRDDRLRRTCIRPLVVRSRIERPFRLLLVAYGV